MRGVRIAFLARDRGGVDDTAVTAFDHVRCNRLAAVEDTVQIDIDHLAPFRRIGVDNGCIGTGDPGICDQDVDAAHLGRRACCC